MKKILLMLLLAVMLFSMCACGAQEGKRCSAPEAMVGSWEKDKLFASFPFSALTIEEDGTVVLDQKYNGYLTSKNGRYEIIVDSSTIVSYKVEEIRDVYTITAELGKDGETLTVFVKAKSGYYYLGDESLTFKKK